MKMAANGGSAADAALQPAKRGRVVLLAALAVLLLVAHQDFWNWNNPTLVGFMPIGLMYHAVFSVACAALMWLLTRFAWPKHLELYERDEASQKQGGHE